MAKSIRQNIIILSTIVSIILLPQCMEISQNSHPKQKVQVQKEIKAVFNKTKLLWPFPKNLTLNETGIQFTIDPCTINYRISATPSDTIKQIINIYLIDVFHCVNIKPGNVTLSIAVKYPNQMIAQQVIHQKYQLTIRDNQEWDINADYYVGFLRGWETFSQLFQLKNGKYVVNYRPIMVNDIPQYIWRGVMIDSSRHFLSVQQIKHQIDALMYNKLNILHWHVTDDDSFPMVVAGVPELAQFGKLSGSYSQAQVKSIINYGRMRGVRVVPEFGTPSRVQSWGRSAKYQDIVVNCSVGWNGQLDPTNDKSYEVVTEVMKEINTTFIDNYVHFGGQIISGECYDRKTSIMDWMKRNNISSYQKLQSYYREKQKNIWRNISKSKKVIYWINQSSEIPSNSQDVIQWYGNSSSIPSYLTNKNNQVILSSYNQTWLDQGFGDVVGIQDGNWTSWRNLSEFNLNIKGVNVIGGEACLAGSLSNQDTADQKIWPRASVLSERFWNSNVNSVKDLLNVAERLITHTKRLKQRGIQVSPFTVGLCERNATICFGTS